MLFPKVKYRRPVLIGRFQPNIVAVIFSKPVAQLIQSFFEGRKMSLLIFCTIIEISDTSAGIDSDFVGIETVAIKF